MPAPDRFEGGDVSLRKPLVKADRTQQAGI